MGSLPTKANRPASRGETTPPASASDKPLAVFSYENISAAVFIDRRASKDGETPLFNISLRRRYRDAAGAWKSSHTLWPSDLLAAAFALRKCYEFVHEGRPEENAE